MMMAALWGCSVKPEPLRYSKDNCTHCKMTLMDKKFGGELVTKKGKIFKFDDIRCMVDFLNSEEGRANDYAYQLVTNYALAESTSELIPVTKAFFVSSPEIKSPMAGNIAAFSEETTAKETQTKLNASRVTWSQLLTQFQ